MFARNYLRIYRADWLAVVVLLSFALDSACTADQPMDDFLGDPAAYWTPVLVDSGTEAVIELPFIEDSKK